ncbi:24288_t:CDS:2 [Dentiscutata erythropus]|uniref:24288_t:CDS:1 n=1 Tax=Dentiscutata erythropus TaxID=1348616 RepID=A0A9N9P0H1_9GLOM|nr:24288_t:CDS:2 [Dentiscutata erythropus]
MLLAFTDLLEDLTTLDPATTAPVTPPYYATDDPATCILAVLIRSGQAFNNCLVDFYQNDTTYKNVLFYNNLLNYSFVETSTMFKVCYNETLYYSNNINTGCNFPNGKGFICSRITQSVFCHNELCGSIIGDVQITSNTTFGYCPFENLSVATNYLSNISPTGLSGLNKGYAHFTCPKNTIFSNNYDSIYRDLYNITNKCYLQWPAPFPSNTTTKIQSTTTPGNSITTVITTMVLDSKNSNLIIGSVIGGVATLVLIEIAIIATLRYMNRDRAIITS